MIITFCGHSRIYDRETIREQLKQQINPLLTGEKIIFYLGGYGDFDLTVAHVLRDMKSSHTEIERILVVPYPNRKYDEQLYDGTVYPPLENVPKRFAISKRNEWMTDRSDIVFAYVSHDWGGAAKTLAYAVRRKKQIINLAESSTLR